MDYMINPTPPGSTPSWIVTPDPALQVNSVALSADGNSCIAGTSNEFSTGNFTVNCYDGAGKVRWSWPFGPQGSTQGVFWVAASADGQFAAAGGETASKAAGLLSAYRLSDGVQVLNATPPSRINQVALSGDGSLLLAVYDDTVELYSYANGAYTCVSQQTFSGAYCNSCALSPDGFAAVVSCTIYNDNGPSTGQVVSLSVANNALTVSGIWISPVGVMRVAIAATGNYWGAALHDGSCALFGPANLTQPVWQYRPTVGNLNVAYGFDITETAEGRVVLACGANLTPPSPVPVPAPPEGYLYLVESRQDGAAQYPNFCWGSMLQYSANPGVSLAREAQLVSATDGKPSSGSASGSQVSESPGNFYLFDGAAGAQLWQYPTPVMNWPMAITPDGAHIFAGSDDGSVYFWGQTAA
jgi:WD40 repeat protein